MAFTQKKEQLVVPPIEKAYLQLTIEGDSPLICHRFSDKARDQIKDKTSMKARGARGAREPEKEYKDSMYLSDDDRPAFPASGIKKACVEACSFINGVTKIQAKGAFYVTGDMLPINGEPKMREDMVRLNGRSADVRYRAEFPKWSINLTILYNPKVLSAEAIVNLLENAGFAVGLGDWRPQKGGNFGMFHVKGDGAAQG